MNSDIISILESLVKAMVEKPEAVKIASFNVGQKIVASVRCAPCDAGKVIGSNGVNINALNLIGQAIADTYQRKIHLTVDVPAGSGATFRRFAANPDYDATAEARLLCDIGRMIYNDGVTVDIVEDLNIIALVMTHDGYGYDELASALNTIFNAIGKAKGINLLVEIDKP